MISATDQAADATLGRMLPATQPAIEGAELPRARELACASGRTTTAASIRAVVIDAVRALARFSRREAVQHAPRTRFCFKTNARL
jgi:hypothetical protein